MRAKIKEHHDEILNLYATGNYGYKQLSILFGCSKSAIEYLIKSRTEGQNWTKKKIAKTIPKIVKSRIVENPKAEKTIKKYEKMTKKRLKKYWADNLLKSTSDNVQLPIGISQEDT